MKKLFVFVIVLIAVAVSGCATTSANRPHFNVFPTVYVEVVNNCFASTIFVKAPGGKEVPIKYGTSATVPLSQYLGDDSQVVLTVRGVGDEGAHLGSSSHTFFTGRSGSRQASWQIIALQGGARPCNPPPRRP